MGQSSLSDPLGRSDPLALGFLLPLSTQSDPLARSALQHLTLRLSDLLVRWDR